MRLRAVVLCAGLLVACGEDESTVETSGATGGNTATTPGAVLACPPGELELPDGSCDPPGVPADGCGIGFEHDGDGGCVAKLPDCAPGQLALAGETECRPVSSCRGGPWGAAPIAASTQFVDASHMGPSDGSATNPWTSVQQALDVATSGAVIAIAPGAYDEDVVVTTPVELWGRCAGEVQIGSSAAEPAITLAADTELHALAITGTGIGVDVAGAATVVLEEVWIHDTSHIGIYGESTTAEVRETLIENATVAGVLALGANVTIESSVIRDTQALDGTFGRAISAETPAGMPMPSQLSVQRSVLERNQQTAVTTIGSSVDIADTLIRDTRVEEATGIWGSAVEAFHDDATGLDASIVVVGSILEQSHSCGICAGDADLTVERTTVRDVKAEVSTDLYGYGLQIYTYGYHDRGRPRGVVRASLVEQVSGFGVIFGGADGSIETMLVRDVASEAATRNYGRGISMDPSVDTLEPANVELRGARVERAHESGISVLSSRATIDSVHVADIAPREIDGAFGVGVAVVPHLSTFAPGQATVSRAVVERAHVAGLLVAAADVVASDIIVRDTLPQPEGEVFGDGIMVSSYLVILPQLFPTSLEATRVTVERAPRAGLAAFAAPVRLANSLFECNAIDLNGETVSETAFELVDEGGNVCGCADARSVCRVLTSNLEPPSLF